MPLALTLLILCTLQPMHYEAYCGSNLWEPVSIMSRNINDIIRKLTPRQRKKVEARAAQLIAEEMTLQQLRQACRLTQQKVAKSLRIGQEGVSKIERRSDLLISTLRDYVHAMAANCPLSSSFQTESRSFSRGSRSLRKNPNKRAKLPGAPSLRSLQEPALSRAEGVGRDTASGESFRKMSNAGSVRMSFIDFHSVNTLFHSLPL
jgi:transcriptional regulator with XRE-family HTH domain